MTATAAADETKPVPTLDAITEAVEEDDEEDCFDSMCEPEAIDILSQFYHLVYRSRCSWMLASMFLRTHERLMVAPHLPFQDMVAFLKEERMEKIAGKAACVRDVYVIG